MLQAIATFTNFTAISVGFDIAILWHPDNFVSRVWHRDGTITRLTHSTGMSRSPGTDTASIGNLFTEVPTCSKQILYPETIQPYFAVATHLIIKKNFNMTKAGNLCVFVCVCDCVCDCDVTVSVTCLCWSLAHAEQLLFSCVSSKVSICNYVTCHISHCACNISYVKWLCWFLGHAD